MATAYSRPPLQSGMPPNADDPVIERNHRTIQGMVDGFARHDIDGIMTLIAEDAVYCDILGDGNRGDEYHGKAAIKDAFIRQFAMAGAHTYIDACIMVNRDIAFASWTMVLGDAGDRSAPQFEGIDEFLLDAAGQVVLKKAWLKGQPRLRRALMRRNPAGALRHLRYVLRTLGR